MFKLGSNLAKDFLGWLRIKMITNYHKERPLFNEKEVWMANIGENIGFEICGKGEDYVRPIIILKKYSKNFFLGICASTKSKDNKYYIKYTEGENTRSAMISQVHSFDSKRLKYRIMTLSDSDFNQIKSAFISSI